MGFSNSVTVCLDLRMLLELLCIFSSTSAFIILDEDDFFEETPLLRSYSEKNDLDPVILVPGLAGSRLQYKNNTGSSWGTLWLSIIRLLNYKTWMEQLTVDYDAETETYNSLSSITVRAEDYGGVDVCLFL